MKIVLQQFTIPKLKRKLPSSSLSAYVIFVQKEKEEEKCREFAKNHAAMRMEQNMAYLSSAKHANNYSCYFLFL